MKEIIEIPIDKEDEKLIAQAEEILTDLGLDRSTALTVFYRQVVLRKGLPFEIDPIDFKQENDRGNESSK
ncbi:type II toxin-antitoxin system RelB/DinJ family antitoxin [Tetragenococcus koreensis]|uniref:Type II toxin-antitoxin system antitoxin, RelB/DinJ family n=1 Tax=Tetragenococcus koreensis TaxID=290335 RepID=A0AAN4UCU9_9ENTE|nr:type II toxin-antitoxin system RelB/DinJ family antitoxin [Tetragenococcus koreensis]MCF1585015.1 type II toxin-antitoxin system RelB/DinJ family antitoxin [Tetragenococcus koreensis]MCF1614528.1 type II toxin-antitoxin system RelB/DinJ family antitoxin [Tetragenococcus koreensis]MCF1624361.1 type II toxin-antitoxin system RelB/DinJ family antitoxin [Tetragenococcus koreensis]MCF1627116.1 type II toxin-antitoxin system RelB/DinJ family antitoxin [Tetragenococcus koreensis]MCF1629245.1 type 